MMTCTLGGKISEFRNAASLTQKELAKMMNVSLQDVSKWEDGTSCPDISSIIKLCSCLKIPLDSFLRKDLMPETFIPPKGERKSPSLKIVKVRIENKGDKILLNLPLEAVKLFILDGKLEAYLNIRHKELVSSVDWKQLLELIDAGVMGKLAEVKNSDSSSVEIKIE